MTLVQRDPGCRGDEYQAVTVKCWVSLVHPNAKKSRRCAKTNHRWPGRGCQGCRTVFSSPWSQKFVNGNGAGDYKKEEKKGTCFRRNTAVVLACKGEKVGDCPQLRCEGGMDTITETPFTYSSFFIPKRHTFRKQATSETHALKKPVLSAKFELRLLHKADVFVYSQWLL